MKQLLAIFLMVAPAWAEPLMVPSGQPVDFIDVIKDAPGNSETTWRYRFLAPQIARDGGTVTSDAAAADIDAICADFVAPMLAKEPQPPAQIIISISDRRVEFGTANPEATQFFEAYSLDGSNCIWEGF